jgi:hypothetical protein
MDWDDYFRQQAALYRQLAEKTEDVFIKRELSATGNDGDSGHRTHKVADETVGDPVGEIIQFRILAASDEGKDGDRRHLRLEPVRGRARQRKARVRCRWSGRRKQPRTGNRS